jgi:hypothetical protein
VPESQQVAALGEECVRAVTAVFEIRGLVPHTETHVAGLCFDTQICHQPGEVGIGPGVVDNEAGIDIDRSGRVLDRNGVGVPAHVIACFEDRQLMLIGQQIGGDHTRNSSTDDGDTH